MRLRPFFPFFGAKWRAALSYPEPRCATIVEPFAGSAGYAVSWHDRRVVLVDADDTIAALWSYLTRVRAAEIRALPEHVECVDAVAACAEARTLIGFWLARSQVRPARRASGWAASGRYPHSFWSASKRDRIAKQVEMIRHWRVIHGDYAGAPEVEATWFVDPPYSVPAGRAYRRQVQDYAELGDWCRRRRGQVIVCDSAAATWLPFALHRDIATVADGGRRRFADGLFHRPWSYS